MSRNTLFTGIGIMACMICFACSQAHQAPFTYETDPVVKELLADQPTYPAAKFIILSDLHYYDTSLGSSGQAFKDYLADDRKLLVYSGEILDTAVKAISQEKADFVIVCGDLTKDGEKVCHEGVAAKLARIAQSGKKLYVIPGNHDVACPDAMRYIGDKTEKVLSISDTEFAKIYNEFGYSSAIERDPNSLSYLAEPIDGLWLLALDSCLWKQNPAKGHHIVDGEFSEETLVWIENMLIRARKSNKAVIVMMHHGILEHYPDNAKHYGEYVVNDFDRVGRMLNAYHVKLVFTGHFHAQDITMKTFENPKGTIYDIETGSLVTYPCPYRIINIKQDQSASIKSRFVTSIPSLHTGFPEYAENYVFEGTVGMADDALIGYKVPEVDLAKLSPQIARAYIAHLKGDEIKPEKTLVTKGVKLWSKLIIATQRSLIDDWWSDLAPADNELTINLQADD